MKIKKYYNIKLSIINSAAGAVPVSATIMGSTFILGNELFHFLVLSAIYMRNAA